MILEVFIFYRGGGDTWRRRTREAYFLIESRYFLETIFERICRVSVALFESFSMKNLNSGSNPNDPEQIQKSGLRHMWSSSRLFYPLVLVLLYLVCRQHQRPHHLCPSSFCQQQSSLSTTADVSSRSGSSSAAANEDSSRVGEKGMLPDSIPPCELPAWIQLCFGDNGGSESDRPPVAEVTQCFRNPKAYFRNKFSSLDGASRQHSSRDAAASSSVSQRDVFRANITKIARSWEQRRSAKRAGSVATATPSTFSLFGTGITHSGQQRKPRNSVPRLTSLAKKLDASKPPTSSPSTSSNTSRPPKWRR